MCDRKFEKFQTFFEPQLLNRLKRVNADLEFWRLTLTKSDIGHTLGHIIRWLLHAVPLPADSWRSAEREVVESAFSETFISLIRAELERDQSVDCFVRSIVLQFFIESFPWYFEPEE